MTPQAPGTLTAELLRPGARAVEHALKAIDVARMVVLGVAVVGILVIAGAKLERWLMKRELDVFFEDVDLELAAEQAHAEAETDGDRG